MIKLSIVISLILAIIFGPVVPLPTLASPDFTCNVVTEIPQIECEALVALYNSTNGAAWIDNTNWLTNTWPWYGVTLEGGHVTQLTIRYNQLSGSIPPELGNLTNLGTLDLFRNQLTGSIPPELGTLTNLSSLSLGRNQLTGSIPVALSNLTNLTSLGLELNVLTGGIPPGLGNLTKLEYFNVHENLLSGSIPPELGNLILLTKLYLSNNTFLTGDIPSELGNLTNLNVLGLDGNSLSGSIPPELGNLTNLNNLYLGYNQLTGSIPTELGNLINLEVLRLNNNQLEGDVPASFVNLVNLSAPGEAVDSGDGLDLDYNALTVPVGYPDPLDPLHVLLSEKDLEWHTLQAVELVIGDDGGLLTALDGSAEFFVPSGTLDGDTTFTFTPLPAPTYDTGSLSVANLSFQLTAEDAVGSPVTVFDPAITVTINYTDEDLPGIPEDSLALFYWDEATSAWLDAVTTCEGGVYTRDPVNNTFSLPVCHLSEFTVVSNPIVTLRICLPLIPIKR